MIGVNYRMLIYIIPILYYPANTRTLHLFIHIQLKILCISKSLTAYYLLMREIIAKLQKKLMSGAVI